uniref:Uncharacterized protein n=1 Tax=Anguilla anguilla TaxID=7936 RepID=A0A0E9S9Y1_ANGAN
MAAVCSACICILVADCGLSTIHTNITNQFD